MNGNNSVSSMAQKYSYAVCLVTLVGFALFTIFGLVGVVKIIIPEYTMSSAEHFEYSPASSSDIAAAKKLEGISDLVRMAAAWLVCVPLFLLHFDWARKMAARERSQRAIRKRYPPKRRPQQHQPRPKSS